MFQHTGYVPREGDAPRARVGSADAGSRFAIDLESDLASIVIHTNNAAVARDYFAALAQAAQEVVDAADLALVATSPIGAQA